MTVETTVSRAQYNTNGTTGPWTVPFYFIESGDLSVIHADADGNETELVLDIGYSVAGAGDPTGTVTTTDAFPPGGTVTILRDVQPVQTSDYRDGDDFPAETLERDIDRLMQLIQQLLELTGRALVFSPSDTEGSTLPPAASRANTLLGFDGAGRLILAAPISGSAADVLLQLANAADLTKGDALMGVRSALAGAIARTQHGKNADLVSVADFTSPVAGAQAAPAALAYLPDGTYAAPESSPRVVTMVGPGLLQFDDGSKSDLNAFRSSKGVLHELAGRIGDIKTLADAISSGAVKVVYWGDSITEGISQIAYEDSWAGQLEDRLRAEFPEVVWTFVNLSIAGRGIGEANSDTYVGTAGVETPTDNFKRLPGWQNDIPNQTLWPSGSTAAKTWYNHIRDEAPDLVLLALGINDTSGDANAWAATLKSLIANRVNIWTKVPSVAVVTPMLPTRKVPSWNTINPYIQANADAMRGVCEELNLTLLDANRLYRAYREGIDPARTRNRYLVDATDYAAWLTITGARPAYAGGTFTWGANGVVHRLSSEMDCTLSARFTITLGTTPFSIWYRSTPGDANKAYVVQIEGAVPQVVLYYNSVAVASNPIPAVANGSTHTLQVVVQGAHHRVYVDGVKRIDTYDYQRLYPGYYGLQINGAGSAVGLRSKAGYARVVGYNEMPEDVLLGPINDYTSNLNSLGGNAINHPSIVGHYTVYLGACTPLIDAIRRLVKRRRDKVLAASASATTGSLTSGDYIDVVIAGTASPQAAYCSVSTADTAYGASNFCAVGVNAGSATIDLRKNGATVLTTCTITFPYAGKWLVMGWGTASRLAGNFRHALTAIAIKQQD